MRIEDRLAGLGYQLPAPGDDPSRPAPGVRTGRLVFTSGRTSAISGKVGRDITPERARDAARESVIRAVAALRDTVGDLDTVRRVVKVTGFVNCASGFADTPTVMNAASELLQDIFGTTLGRHARSAIGAAELPGDAAVEIELVVEISAARRPGRSGPRPTRVEKRGGLP